MKLLITAICFILQISSLLSMEEPLDADNFQVTPVQFGLRVSEHVDPSLRELQEITKHWLITIEQQRFEAEKCKTELGDSLFRRTTTMLDGQESAVKGFLSKIDPSSLAQLLDDLLLYRMRYIKTRKKVIDKAQQSGSRYVELAPLSEDRVKFYTENTHLYSAISYETNMSKSFCLHQLIKAVFERIGDPSQLNANTKHKICAQPSLFAYLQGDTEVPWALDFTLGIQVPGYTPYHDVPDYALIRDYVEEYGYLEAEVGLDTLKVVGPFMRAPTYSTMYKSFKRFILTRFEANQYPKEPDFADVNRFAATFQIEYSLPYPEFLKRRPALKTVVSTSENARQAMSAEHPAVDAIRKAESKAVSDTKPITTIEAATIEKQGAFKPPLQPPLASPPATKETSRFAKVENWLRDKLFSHQIKTINGDEWESTLKRIKGVSVRENSKSSHFEVLMDGRVIGGYFRAKEYGIGYKKWLKEIILKTGFSPEGISD